MLCFSVLFGLLSSAHALPDQLSQHGRLLDSTGQAITGMHNLTFWLYDSPTSSSPLWSEAVSVIFNNGYYATTLGSDPNNPLDESVLGLEPLYLEIEVDNNGPMSPRQQLSSTPFAKLSGQSQSLDGGTVNATEISVGGTVVVDANGSWVGPTIAMGWNNLSGIPADIADGDDDTLAGLSCGVGQIVGWDGNQWVCSDDNGLTEAQVENYVTNGALDFAAGSQVDGSSIVTTATDQDSFADLGMSCSGGDIAKWDGGLGEWVCDIDAVLSDNQVQNIVSSAPIDLHSSTTIGGQTILSSTTCGNGEILSYNTSTSSWDCASFQILLDSDSDGVMAWNDCDDSDPNSLSHTEDSDCDGVLTADDCNDNDPGSTTYATDADCDGFVTALDCDDSDPFSTIRATDSDCDGIPPVDDCDDTDPALGAQILDNDCDGFLTADDCDDNDSSISTQGTGTSDVCAGYSCFTILNDGYSTGDGPYWIDPSGSNPIQVACDMSTEGGGYTYYPVDSGISTSAYTDNNTCKGLGMDIVFPRSKSHWISLLSRYDSSYFVTVPGVYKSSDGGSYTNCAMKSGGCSDWRVGDGGRWWLRDTSYGEPNGDYNAHCWLAMFSWDVNDFTFNDGYCSYSTSRYICSTNDKP